MGGAVGRVPSDATAFGHREAEYNLLILDVWEHAADDEANREWVRGVWQAVQPYAAGGVYVNYLGTEEDEGTGRLAGAYEDSTLERLRAVKGKYDPENLFRVNQNIRPG